MVFRLLDLPNELLDHTLSLLDDFDDRFRALLTCKRLQGLINVYLYRAIPIRPNPHSLPAFVRLVCHKPTILNEIKCLDVGDWHARRRDLHGLPQRGVFPGLTLSSDWDTKAASRFSSMLSKVGNQGNDEGRHITDVLGDLNLIPNEALVALLLKHTQLRAFSHYIQQRGEPQWLQLFHEAMIEPEKATWSLNLQSLRLLNHRPQQRLPDLCCCYLHTCLMLPTLQEVHCDDASGWDMGSIVMSANLDKYSHPACRARLKRPSSVKRLTLTHCKLSGAFLRQLLVLVQSGLEHLTIHQSMQRYPIPDLFDLHAFTAILCQQQPGLRSLTLRVRAQFEPGRLGCLALGDLSQMTQLTHLRIDQEAIISPTLWRRVQCVQPDGTWREDFQQAMLSRLQQLPENIETLEISAERRSLVHVVGFLKVLLENNVLRPRSLRTIRLWNFDATRNSRLHQIYDETAKLATMSDISIVAHGSDLPLPGS